MTENKLSSDTAPPFAIDRRSYLRALGATGTGLTLGGVGGTVLESGTAKAAPTTIEDFERTGPLSDYSGHTGNYTVTTTSEEVIDGSKTLKATSSYGQISNDTVSTPRGYEYRVRIELGNNAAEPALLTCVQNTSSPNADCYMAHMDVSAGILRLSLRQGGSYTTSQEAPFGSLSTGTIYELAIELASDTIKATLYDSSGSTVLAETSAITDSTWSGGLFGFYTGGSGLPAYYDTVTKESLSSDGRDPDPDIHVPSSQLPIDQFDDGDLSEYSTSDGESSPTLVDSPTYTGSKALRLEAYAPSGGSIVRSKATSYSGLAEYPSAGTTFRMPIRFTSGTLPLIRYGLQPNGDCYTIRFRNDGYYGPGTKIWFKVGADGSADDSDVTTDSELPMDTWHELEVDWRLDGTHTASVYNQNGSKVLEVSTVDTSWTAGGIGFEEHLGSGPTYIDNVSFSSHPRVTDRKQYEGAPLDVYAVQAVKDPNHNRIAFTTTAFDNCHELYLATGITSTDQVPEHIYRTTGDSLCGVFNMNWNSDGTCHYERRFVTYDRETPTSNDAIDPTVVDGDTTED